MKYNIIYYENFNNIHPWMNDVFFDKITISTQDPFKYNVCVIHEDEIFEHINNYSLIRIMNTLKHRQVILISRRTLSDQNHDISRDSFIVVESIEKAFQYITFNKSVENVFFFGNYILTEEIINKSENLYKIKYILPCRFNEKHEINEDIFCKNVLYRDNKAEYYHYKRKVNIEEQQYLDLIQKILDKGKYSIDRTEIGTLSTFGNIMRFNLRKHFPLITTKKVFWRGICEELLWFISGSPNSNLLKEKGIHIWDNNTTKEFIESRGLDYEEGSIGKGYGFQWRHCGAEYTHMNDDYTNKGKDQLNEVINMIKTDPNSRRIILSAWNVCDLDKMVLPPCHILCQFYVKDKELSCIMYQRSCDMGLGIPFNIASYALLTNMIAKVCDLLPGDFIHMLGDTHVYVSHIEALKQQLERIPNQFPKLKLDKVEKIDDFKMEHIYLSDYYYHDSIKMNMAI